MHRIYISSLMFLCTSPAMAAERIAEDDKGVFSIVWENDIFAGTDRDYTNGVRLSWISSEENMPEWSQSIAHMLPMENDGNKRISIAAGQSMFAPEDITRRTPIAGDHPYAGWLYGSVGLVSDTGKILDNVVLTVGVVGPLSYAQQTQSFVHHVVDSPHPEGWDICASPTSRTTELRNEALIRANSTSILNGLVT